MTGRPRRSVARPVSYAKIDAGSDIGDDEDDPHLKELERQETTEDDESEDEFKMDVDEEHGEEEEEDDDDDDEQADTDDASNSRSSMEPDETPVPLKNENGDLAWGSPASKRYKMRPISAKIAARPPPKLHQPPSQKFHRAVRDLIDDLNHPNYEEVELDAAWGGIHAGPVLQFQRNMGWKFTEQNNDLYPSFMSIDDLTLVDANQAVKHMPPEGTVKIMTGPPGLATRTELQNYSTYDLSSEYPKSESIIFNAGTSIWAADWCSFPSTKLSVKAKQYFVLGGLEKPHAHKVLGLKDRNRDSILQIWSLDTETRVCSLEMVLLHEYGSAWELKFCPLPQPQTEVKDGIRILGLLAGCFGDGTIRFIQIPHPEDIRAAKGVSSNERIYVASKKLHPSITVPSTICLCFSWKGCKEIGVGFENGAIAVYDIPSIMSGQEPIPIHHFLLHRSPVNRLDWLGRSANPQMISSAYDGHVLAIDLRDTTAFHSLSHMRYLRSIVGWSPFMHAYLRTESGSRIELVHSKYPLSSNQLKHFGSAIWDFHSSDSHPFIAVVLADGTCWIANVRRAHISRHNSITWRCVYRMAYDTESRTYRFIDNIQPELPHKVYPAVQPTEIGIQKVVWNPNHAYGGWILSASASGLCRVDNMEQPL